MNYISWIKFTTSMPFNKVANYDLRTKFVTLIIWVCLKI